MAGASCSPVSLLPFSSEDRCPRKAPSGGLPNRSQATVVPTLPFSPGPCRVSMGLGAVSAGDLRESSGPPSAPPSKRHCRSLSEPDEHARCQSPWRPGGSRVWTAVSKRRCHSGGSSCLPGGACLAAGPGLPPVPRPASASSSFLDRNGSGSGPPWCPMGTYALSPRRRLSLSQEHLADADSPPSPPELGWRLGLPRSRSQPCVLVGRTSRLKRRRDEGTRWLRPSLDFQKMTRVRPLPASRQPPCRCPCFTGWFCKRRACVWLCPRCSCGRGSLGGVVGARMLGPQCHSLSATPSPSPGLGTRTALWVRESGRWGAGPGCLWLPPLHSNPMLPRGLRPTSSATRSLGKACVWDLGLWTSLKTLVLWA